MPVKILIKRRFKEKDISQNSKMLITARHGAMEQEGYISSETMWDLDDPKNVVVSSMWQDIESWNSWKNSEKRKSLESQFMAYLDGPTKYEHYFLGLYPH
jgi:heme-degrading monooxygenase HmoA